MFATGVFKGFRVIGGDWGWHPFVIGWSWRRLKKTPALIGGVGAQDGSIRVIAKRAPWVRTGPGGREVSTPRRMPASLTINTRRMWNKAPEKPAGVVGRHGTRIRLRKVGLTPWNYRTGCPGIGPGPSQAPLMGWGRIGCSCRWPPSEPSSGGVGRRQLLGNAPPLRWSKAR